MVVWSALATVPVEAASRTAAEQAERPSLEVEESAQEHADRSDRATDHNAVRMLDRVIIKYRAKPLDAATPIPDAWLTAKTKLALAADERLKSRLLKVETQNGIVTLSGSVYSDDGRRTAVDIVKTVEGIKSVKNSLQVIASSRQEATEEADHTIAEKVSAALKQDSKLKRIEITVRTEAGIVTLTGTAPDLTASAQAAWTAWKIKGVRAVKNEVSVKSK